MASATTKLVLRTAGISALTGMRSMSGPALLTLDRKLVNSTSPAAKFLDSRYLTLGVQVFAVGELIADKLPFVPKRTWFPALFARAAAGAVVGAFMFEEQKESPINGAVIGGLSAIAATYASYYIRRTLTKTLHVPDFIVAIAEDSIVVSRGMKLLEQS